MRRQYGDFREFPLDMPEEEIIPLIEPWTRELEHFVENVIRTAGGEPIPETVVRIYKSARDQDYPLKPNGEPWQALVAVKMYGEFPE